MSDTRNATTTVGTTATAPTTRRPRFRRAARRATLGGALAGACLLLAATPSAAHVTVNPDEAEQGGYATVDVKVPNERDDAATTRVELVLPTDHPLTSAQPQRVPGWEVKVTTRELDEPVEVHGERVTEAPSRIVWSGGRVEPGTFQQFPVSLGPLPKDADQVVLKALQTYDDGEVVRWIEEPGAGGEEPENPAAVLRLSPAGDTGAGDGTERAADRSGTSPQAAPAGDDAGGDTTARTLGVVGIALGAAGLAVGLRGRRRTTD